MRQAIFLTSPDLWQHGHGQLHPLKPERLQRTFELLQEYGAFRGANVNVISPRPATNTELTLFHTQAYVDLVHSLSQGNSHQEMAEYGFGSADNPVFDSMYESECLKAGSTLQGAELLAQGDCDVAFSYAGGFHHAKPSTASGFCIFNDIAIAIH